MTKPDFQVAALCLDHLVDELTADETVPCLLIGVRTVADGMQMRLFTMSPIPPSDIVVLLREALEYFEVTHGDRPS
jgi:hypothetical protein